MQEFDELEEAYLRNVLGFIFDNNESVGKKRDETGWSNVRKEGGLIVIKGSSLVNGEKKEFYRTYDCVEDILNGRESNRTNNTNG